MALRRADTRAVRSKANRNDKAGTAGVDTSAPAATPAPGATRKRAVIGAVDQMVWAGQNFIAILTFSHFLDGRSLGAFAVVGAFISLLTGSVLHGIGEYLSVADRDAMQRRHRSARSSLYRRATTVGVLAAVVFAFVGFALGGLMSEELRSAFRFGAIAIAALMPYEAMRAWLLLTRQAVEALYIDLARLGLHAGLTILLPAMGVPWSIGEVMLIWSLSALFVVLAVDGAAFAKSLLGRIAEVSSFDIRRQIRYASDYLFLLGPEQATIPIIAASSGLGLSGTFRLVLAGFLPANAIVQGIRAINTIPDDQAAGAGGRGRRIMVFTAVALAVVATVIIALMVIPADWVAVVAGDVWHDARPGVFGVGLQRLAAAGVVMMVLYYRWRVDDKVASGIRRIFAAFVLLGAVLTGTANTIASAALIFGVTALTGGVLTAAWAWRQWSSQRNTAAAAPGV